MSTKQITQIKIANHYVEIHEATWENGTKGYAYFIRPMLKVWDGPVMEKSRGYEVTYNPAVMISEALNSIRTLYPGAKAEHSDNKAFAELVFNAAADASEILLANASREYSKYKPLRLTFGGEVWYTNRTKYTEVFKPLGFSAVEV